MMNNQTFEERYRGKKYGQLVILRKDPFDKSEHVMYVIAHCQACGQVKKMLINNIIYGLSKTCGCGRLLAVSKARRNMAKITVATPDGPKTLRWLADHHGVSYAVVHSRWVRGAKTLDTIFGKRPRKPLSRNPSEILNDMTNKEVAHLFNMSPQAVSHRVKTGWRINEKNEWVSPARGVVGTKVFRMSKTAEKRLKKRKMLAKLYE